VFLSFLIYDYFFVFYLRQEFSASGKVSRIFEIQFNLPQAIPAMSIKFSDIITPYDGTTDFSEWIDKVELVAKLQKVKELHNFFPLFFSGSAYNVYKSIPDDKKEDYETVKNILTKKFCSDACLAYEELIRRNFLTGETVENYYADICRLGKLVDPNISENIIKSAFLAGLPLDVKDKIRSSNDVISTALSEIVDRAKSIIKSSEICSVACYDDIRQSQNFKKPFNKYNSTSFNNRRVVKSNTYNTVECYNCKSTGHIARSCPNRYCFVCGAVDHLAPTCPDRCKQKNE